MSYWDASEEGFLVNIATPKHPWSYIIHRPDMHIITYLTYLLGTITTITGVSILGLSPFNVMMKRKRKKIKCSLHHVNINSIKLVLIQRSISRKHQNDI